MNRVKNATPDSRNMWAKIVMKEKPSKSPEELSSLNESLPSVFSASDKPESHPHLVCVVGSAGSLRQQNEIFRDFVPPDNVAWVTLSHGHCFDVIDRAVASKESVVAIYPGVVECLVARKIYVVSPHCTVSLSGDGELKCLPPEKESWPGIALSDTPFTVAQEISVEALAAGSPHPLRVVFLSSLELRDFPPPVLEGLHRAGAEFFIPLLTPYPRPGRGAPVPHKGGLTDKLVGGPIPYKAAALNELVSVIIESIGEED